MKQSQKSNKQNASDTNMRGGVRANAGRKKGSVSPDKKQPITIYVFESKLKEYSKTGTWEAGKKELQAHLNKTLNGL